MKKLSLLVLLASISCGGGNESAPPATSPSATPGASTATPPADSAAPAASAAPSAPASASSASTAPSGDAPVAGGWKDMNKEQRAKFMRETVVPKMKPLFVAFNGKYEKFGCGTCHGAGAADKSFKMPNPQLPVLPATAEGFEALGKKHPEAMKFMTTQVKPEMAKLLGEKEMDPNNPQAGGFACMNCHTMKK
jgi:hypothetical protein